jgi:CO dehydrogenase nickel-insertion accessory protein CooC1
VGRDTEAIASIATVASGSAGVIVNRARGSDDLDRVRSMTELPVLGAIPEDDLVRRFDAEGRSLLELPGCPALSAVAAISAPLTGAVSSPSARGRGERPIC